MDAGERITSTRDEHYDLVSVLYHALQGADACDRYALDAEMNGNERLVGFFREAQVVYTEVAERAKMLLGILEVPPDPAVPPDMPPEGGVSPRDVPTHPADMQTGEGRSISG
jgi:hypothetical protein